MSDLDLAVNPLWRPHQLPTSRLTSRNPPAALVILTGSGPLRKVGIFTATTSESATGGDLTAPPTGKIIRALLEWRAHS